MKTNKGISLIVLVITIVVIIILTGAIVLNLSANNPINQANTAVSASNVDSVESALSAAIGQKMATTQSSLSIRGGLITSTVSTSAAQWTSGGTTANIDFATFINIPVPTVGGTTNYYVDPWGNVVYFGTAKEYYANVAQTYLRTCNFTSYSTAVITVTETGGVVITTADTGLARTWTGAFPATGFGLGVNAPTGTTYTVTKNGSANLCTVVAN